MALSIGNVTFDTDATNATSYDATHDSNGGYLVLIAMTMKTNETEPTLSATFDSVAMSSQGSITTTTTGRFYKIEAFTLDAPNAGSLTANVASSTALASCIIGVYSVSGEAASPIGATGTNAAGCTADVLTTQANSYIFTGSMQRSNTTPPTITAEANQTEIGNANTGSANTEMVGAAFYRAATSVTTYTVGGTASAIIGDIAFALEIKELVSAGVVRMLSSLGAGR